MENRNIEELANNFVFRYVSNSKHFNIVSLEEFDKASENIKVDLKNNITNDTFDKLERKGSITFPSAEKSADNFQTFPHLIKKG